MTLHEQYRALRRQLRQAGCEDADFDARCLVEDACGIPPGQWPLYAQQPLTPEQQRRIEQAAARRCRREPLQYILRSWAFLDLTLEVGPGVLIPRPETEGLCRAAAEHLARTGGRRVLDLCAGTGCVGLGVASLLPGAAVTAVEKYDEAFGYLCRNIRRYPAYRVTAVRADVLCPPTVPGPFDAIVCNPPYIERGALPGLQPEVGFEPPSALDGGEDGLLFYRAIVQGWLPLLAPGGIAVFEVGAGQAQAVQALLAAAGCRTGVQRDPAGIDRIVYGCKEPI
ncbi:MAG: peptide chain release factor N(5)-glutamine methyltransferase [Clostridia bacterium]|nr:peptide chain release factor N(5)-glutamine methyltransferase [Clostridia bacterium]